jgi:hypothetical protein
MEQDISQPQRQPKTSSQSFSPLGCFLSAAGATMTTASLLGTAAAAAVWALVKLWGLPDNVLPYAIALSQVPVLVATIWVMGRAWHVERRLSAGLDVDRPRFEIFHYLKKA